MTEQIALICGITGQDGAYLARLLIGKGYKVYGTSRDAENARLSSLKILGVDGDIKIISMDAKDFTSVFSVVNQVNPDEIYYLAGQSSVGLSFELPSETIQSIVTGTLNFLEICRISKKEIRFYQAGSSECYGNTPSHKPANENSNFNPQSPYAVAKSSAYWLVNTYREAYNIYACTGILFNHESSLRPQRFVTQKIISGARDIANGKKDKLILGRLDISRDWGWAPEYVEAMWLMLQQDTPKDYIVATGHSHTLAEFIKYAFDYFDLEWTNYVVESEEFYRPSDILRSEADPSLIATDLDWKAKVTLPDIVLKMMTSQ